MVHPGIARRGGGATTEVRAGGRNSGGLGPRSGVVAQYLGALVSRVSGWSCRS